jgi:hypothetical protein
MIAMKCKRLYLWGFFALLLGVPTVMLGQADRGSIRGTVSDPSGAVVDSVDVVATIVATGEQFKTVSNGMGFYSLPELPVGNYNVTFKRAGFKELSRTGLVLEAQHTVQINAVLQVGSVTQTVTVTGTPVLELQTEMGTNMSTETMTDLPLDVSQGRDITGFAFAATPNVNGGEWDTNIAGSQGFTKAVLIDGTSSDSGVVGHIAESEPSMDAIQESQIDVAGLSAEDGRSGGGAFVYELKSGTNRFHGSAFEFLANAFLDANTWDNNWYLSQCASGDTTCSQQYKRAQNSYYDYGFSGGGPVWRKWLGLKKMYIFTAYERYMQADWVYAPNQMTVPTGKMLTGDFSELLTNGATVNGCTASPCPIMNGNTPYYDPAGNPIYYGSIFSPQGNVYPGNIITDPISPIAQKIASIYQQYYKPQTDRVTGNYPALANAQPWFHQTQFSIKYDWDLRDADHISSSYIYTFRPRTCPDSGCGGITSLWAPGTTAGGPLADATQQIVTSNAYRINEKHVFSPNLLNVVAYTFNAFQNKGIPATQLAGDTNWSSELGFGDVDAIHQFPLINFAGSPNGVGTPGIGTQIGPSGYVAYNAILNDTLNWTKGRHQLKFGGEYRALGFNQDTLGGGLQFNFNSATFSPTNTAISTYTGSAFANFLLGDVSSANRTTPIVLDSRRKEISLFAEDDIRVTQRFMVSASLRWEITEPLHVLGGEWTNFDPNATSQAFIGLDGKGVKGAVSWLAHPGDSFETYADWHQFAPKIGGSYQVNKNIVVRGSLGINFVPLGWNTYSATPYGSAIGYQEVNQVQAVGTRTSYSMPAFQWDQNHYPGVITPATGPDPTLTALPWGVDSIDSHTRQLGFMENWYAALQYQLPNNAKIEVSYLGNSGRNLHDGALNPLNYPTWSKYQPLLLSGDSGNWISNQGDATNDGVPYPYQGFSGVAWMAVKPFPQVWASSWGGVYSTNSPLGQSGYNTITVEGIKQRGPLTFDLSYSWDRQTGNTASAFIDTWTFNYAFQDPYAYKHYASYPYTNDKVKGYATYVLPFGQGRRYLSSSHLLDCFVGGWEAAAIVSYGNGTQVGAIGSSNYYAGWSTVYANMTPGASFKNTFKKWNPAWNPVNGADSASQSFNPSNFSNPTYGDLGNSPYLFSNWRGWATPSENASFLKKTHFGSDRRYVFTLRGELYDIFNRHYWNNPNTTISSAYFGHVTGVSGNRTGQLGARFEW